MSSIKDKINTITKFFNKPKSSYSCEENNKNLSQVTGDALIAFVENYKGVRRIILAVVLWINIHIFFITVEMYRTHAEIDVQWIVFAGYWTAILGTFISFYTLARTKEFNSQTSYSRPGEWMQKKETKLPSSYTVSEYTEEDNPSFYNDSVPVEIEELDGDALVEGDEVG